MTETATPTRRRPRQGEKTGKQTVYEPSPEQIAEVCRAIRAEWSDDEHERRQVAKPPSWQVPRSGADADSG